MGMVILSYFEVIPRSLSLAKTSTLALYNLKITKKSCLLLFLVDLHINHFGSFCVLLEKRGKGVEELVEEKKERNRQKMKETVNCRGGERKK